MKDDFFPAASVPHDDPAVDRAMATIDGLQHHRNDPYRPSTPRVHAEGVRAPPGLAVGRKPISTGRDASIATKYGRSMAYAATRQQANLRAMFCVAAEICRRGAWADVVTKRPALVWAGRQQGGHEIAIRVNMRRSGDWQPGLPKVSDPHADFRILVDMKGDQLPNEDDYYVVPEAEFTSWVRADHKRYTDLHGGGRAQGGDSPHKRVTSADARKLGQGWDILGIF